MAIEQRVQDLPGPLKVVDTLVRHWWAVMLRGLVAILFGIIMIGSPRAGMGVVVGFFAAFAIISGVLAIAAAIGAGKEHRSWGALLLDGVLNLAGGVIALVWPGLTMLVLTLLIGFWAIAIGIIQLVAAVRLRKEIPNEWLLGLGGAASVAFGILAVIHPGIGAASIVTVLGIYALIFGGSLVGLGYRLGHLKGLLPARVEARG